MARSISHLKPGQKVTLHFRGSRSLGNEGYVDTVVFKEHIGVGDDQRAVFTDENGRDQWEAYKFQGRWSYGTSAERLSIMK